MLFYPIIILAIVQGITEFLPISSSGHLVLLHHFFPTGLQDDENRILDVGVHVGTLLSVLLYFRRDVWAMIQGVLGATTDTQDDDNPFGKKLFLNLVIGTVPVLGVGFIINQLDPSFLYSVYLVAWCLIIFGIILFIADRFSPRHRTLADLTWKDALIIGCAQCFSLMPGTSRAGITMTAGRLRGLERTETARFSLLLAIFAIGAAGALKSVDLFSSTNPDLLVIVGLGILVSFLTGYAIIGFMMEWLKQFNFTVFVVYRIALGMILLVLLHQGIITE